MKAKVPHMKMTMKLKSAEVSARSARKPRRPKAPAVMARPLDRLFESLREELGL